MNRPVISLPVSVAMSVAMLSLAALAACTPKTETKVVDSVATVDGHEVARGTYREYAKGVAGKPAEDLTPQQQQELLDTLVRGEVIANTAEASGLAARDETKAALALSRLSILQQAVQQDYLKDRRPSEQELRAEYDLQVSQMDATQYRASHILVPTADAAKALITQLAAGGNFAALARAQSTDAGSKEKGGDLDWFTPASMTPAFADAVRKLKKGETSAEPVQTQFGYHVIRVTDTRQATPPPYESVKDRLVQLVENKKFKAYVDGLVEKAKVTKTL
ncbi:MAG: peptidylprolyl isomerase [Steroidobacteraceae bacterium]